MPRPDLRLVVFAPYGRRAGSSRVRLFEWIEHLHLNATVLVFTEENAAGFRQVVRRPIESWKRHRELAATQIAPDDIVLIHRELSPFSDGKAEERLLRSGSRGIVDLDDGLQWDWGAGGLMRRFQPKSPKVLRMVRAADIVIAGNDLIAEWAGQHASRVVVIPSCVDSAKYERKTAYGLSGPPRIGWIGTVTTERYLGVWTAALLEAHGRLGARLTVMGDVATHSGAIEPMIDRVPWTEAGACSLASKCDVGIMPLADGLLERSKCGYKLLQYGAAALPSIASTVGVNAEITGGRETGRGDGLVELLSSSVDQRRAAGERARVLVDERFTFEANAHLISPLVGGAASAATSGSERRT